MKIKYVFVLLFIIIYCGQACKNMVDCDDCSPERPDSGYIDIYMSASPNIDSVRLKLFEGTIESGILLWDSLIDYTHQYYYHKAENFYSAVAIYYIKTDTIVVTNGDWIKVKDETSQCEEDCYVLKNGEIDLKLRPFNTK